MTRQARREQDMPMQDMNQKDKTGKEKREQTEQDKI